MTHVYPDISTWSPGRKWLAKRGVPGCSTALSVTKKEVSFRLGITPQARNMLQYSFVNCKYKVYIQKSRAYNKLITIYIAL